MTVPLNDPSVVGITSTIPVEIVLAAGRRPVDLNNVFITSPEPERLLRQAETAGFAHNICAWIKGIYSTVLNEGVRTVIAVTGGDCSNTVALSELMSERGVDVIHFAFPPDRQRDALWEQMDMLRRRFSATWEDIERTRERLGRIRTKLREMDRMTHEEGLVSGFENHLFLVSSSDFNSHPDRYEKELDRFLADARKRPPLRSDVRLGYLGVPPVFGRLYETLEAYGARVVFNEIQRQFSMPVDGSDIVDQYLAYTYPYDFRGRLEDIRRAVKERALDGLIHYTQTFCYRQIYDIMLREGVDLPILTLEGDRPGQVDSRTAIRLETFVEMVRGLKKDGEQRA